MAKIGNRKKVGAGQERKMVLGMIVSDAFLKKVSDIYQPQLIKAAHINILAGWCLDHYKAFQKAPGIHIQDIFDEKMDELDPENEDLISDFLGSISDEFEREGRFNVEYVLKKVETYLDEKNIKATLAEAKSKVAAGQIDEALLIMKGHKKIQLPQSKGINPFTDNDAIKEAFQKKAESLFKLPGKLGQFLDGVFIPDSFVVFLAPEKRGKTWLLWELAERAAGQRCNVAFFDIGDMSREQSVRRAHIRLAKKSNLKKFVGEVLMPVADCKLNQYDECTLKHRACQASVVQDEKKGTLVPFDEAPEDYVPCTYCRKKRPRAWEPAVWQEKVIIENPLTWKEAVRNGRKFGRRMVGKNFKLVNLPNSSVSMHDIETYLDVWEEQEGFIPDLLFIDYIDITDDEPGSIGDPRNRIDITWRAARRLSQKRHLCVVTDTQAASTGYDKASLDMSDFSNSKTKNAHVTAMLAINQTKEEKEKGVIRIGKVAMREDSAFASKQCTVLQCIQRGMPYVDSF